MKKVIIISGTTAVGKSKVAEEISKDFENIKISADSRQVYKNIPLFSGLDKKDIENDIKLISFLNEDKKISAGVFLQKAENEIKKAHAENKIPIIVGGTSFYLKSLLYKNFLPKVEINEKLRKELEKKDIKELLEILKQKDEKRYESIDKNNKPRIIRALEIIDTLGFVPENKEELKDYDIFYIWLDCDKEKRDEKIKKNFEKRIKAGLLQEAESLKKTLEKKLEKKEVENIFISLGLCYKFIYSFWSGEISKEEFIKLGIKEEQKYAKRQITYIKKFFENFPESVKKEKYNVFEMDFLGKLKDDLKVFLGE